MIESNVSCVVLRMVALDVGAKVTGVATRSSGADNQAGAFASGTGSSIGDGGSGSIFSTDSTRIGNRRKSHRGCRTLESMRRNRSHSSSAGLNWTGSDSDSSSDSVESEDERGERPREHAWDSKIAGVRGKEVSDVLCQEFGVCVSSPGSS